MTFNDPVERMQSALERMNELVQRAANQVLRADAGPEQLTPEDEQIILDQVTPVIRDYLTANLYQSGLKRRTGRLQQAVRNANVWLARSKNGKSIKLMIGFQAGIPGDIKSKDPNQRPVYTYGSALNYGAVYQKLGLGQRAKKKVKREVLRQVQSAGRSRSKYRVERFGRNILVNRGVKRGGMTIIQPRNFFRLTPQQTAQVAALFQEALLAVAVKQRTA